MKFSHYLSRLFYLTIVVPTIIHAQNSEIVQLTKHIGFTLDAEENKYYEVFTDIPNFESAQFFQINTDTIQSRISYLEFTRKKISIKNFTAKSFVDLQIRLSKKSPITDEIRDSYRKNLTYLRTKDILANIPKGQFVEVNHINGKKVKGTLISFNKDRLFIQTPMSVKMIKMTSMERITYRNKIIDRPEWQKFIYSGAALLGLMMMELWNRQTDPIWAYRWHNRFFGATLGLLAGAELYDTSMIIMTKKTKFGLSSSELEKLNRK
tara:strand:+ start:2272 stop:3066 length:795 start_codon:yes stop_codon:yes gene_type:complete